MAFSTRSEAGTAMRWLSIVGFAFAGALVGVLSEIVTHALGLETLVPFAVDTVALCAIAVVLRRMELPEFFIRGFAFAYAAFLGISAVRSTERGLLVYSWIHGEPTQHIRPVEGLPILICVVGLGLAAAMVAFSILAWALAQRLDRPGLDDRAAAFLDFLDESKR